MPIECVACGKLVENYVFLLYFCGKAAQKSVEKCVQNLWIEFVQKTIWWKKSFHKMRGCVQKFGFARVLQSGLNTNMHKWKRWLFPRKKGVLHIFHRVY